MTATTHVVNCTTHAQNFKFLNVIIWWDGKLLKSVISSKYMDCKYMQNCKYRDCTIASLVRNTRSVFTLYHRRLRINSCAPQWWAGHSLPYPPPPPPSPPAPAPPPPLNPPSPPLPLAQPLPKLLGGTCWSQSPLGLSTYYIVRGNPQNSTPFKNNWFLDHKSDFNQNHWIIDKVFVEGGWLEAFDTILSDTY